MKRSILSFSISFAAYFAFGQCGPYTLTVRDSVCPLVVLSVSGASAAQKIIWQKNGIAFDTMYAVAAIDSGITIAGGNGQGSGTNQLNFPSGVYLDGGANIYVADAMNNRIQKFPAGSTSATNGTTVAGGNGADTAADQLYSPYGIYVDHAGDVYVADVDNERIQKFPAGSTSATNGITVAGGNGYGSAADQFFFPFNVYEDSSGNTYVADYNNSRIQKFLPGSTSASNGITVADQLSNPTDVYVDPSGNIYVADYGNNRIQKFPPNSTTGTLGVTVAGGNQGNGSNDLTQPQGLYVDATGNIYVADQGNHRIQRFPAGSNATTNAITVAGGNGPGSAANQLNSPSGVYVDGAGNIYIADTQNERIQKWPRPGITVIDTSLIVTSPGLYSAIIVNDSGCVALTDTISDHSGGLSQTICQGSFYQFDGNNLYNSGTYYDTLPSVGGCDSLITLNLMVTLPATSIIYDSICQGSAYSFDGNNISIPGIYYDTIMGGSVLGCDSLVILSLSVINYGISAYFTLQPSATPHLWYAVNQCTGPNLAYVWSWGDSTTSIGDTPSHIYTTAGYYHVCVTVTDTNSMGFTGCYSTYCDTSVYLFKGEAGDMVYINVVTQLPSGISSINSENLKISSYGGSVHFSETLEAPTQLRLYDMSGRKVMQQDGFGGSIWNINTEIASGVYIIQLQNSSYSLSKKLIVTR